MIKQRAFQVGRIEAVGYNRVELILVQDEGRSLQLLYRGPDDSDARPGAAANGGREGGDLNGA